HPRAPDLRVESAGGPPLLAHAQAPLLGQLLDNLLDNACKYSPPGTPVTVRLARESQAPVLRARGRGPGIAPEELPPAFAPCYPSARPRRSGAAGVGLGLAVARRIASAFGGTLDAESDPGKGSCFTLRLPAAPEDPRPPG